jgi:two-component system sensor histidine kinase KdpD
VALITGVIGLLLAWHVRITNISMLYLLPVLALATVFGRGPAVLASLLAFLSFDFFFVQPLHQFTVRDPFELVSLLMLLLTALVTGQLTAILRLRAREARQQEQSTATLYGLAQLIAAGADLDALLQEMAQRVVSVFAPTGVEACTILLPGPGGSAVAHALAPSSGEAMEALRSVDDGRRHAVEEVLRRGAGVSLRVPGHPPDAAGALVVRYVPLRSGDRTVGVLGVAGGLAIGGGASAGVSPAPDEQHMDRAVLPDPPTALFDAFCGQIALAIEHTNLEQAAVHAEALRESDRLKDILLGSVTHDLRTPLAAIKAITSGMLQPDVRMSEAERQELIASIDQSVNRLSRLVSNLLDLSRLEAGVAVPQRDWYLIGDVVATVLDRLDRAGQTRGRQVEVDVPDDLPLAFVDHEQLEQVLTNLVENAAKYSAVESPIRIAARVRGGELPGHASRLSRAELEIKVSDRGVGIPAGELEAIFDKFYRAQRAQLAGGSTRLPAGSGLGLAICRAIVEAHGGYIAAESQEGVGTILTFTLPIPSDMPRGELPEIVPAPKDMSAAQCEPDTTTSHTMGASA